MKGNRFSKAPQKTRKPKVAPKEMTTTTTTTTTGLSKMSGVDLSASGIDPSISSGSSGGLNIQGIIDSSGLPPSGSIGSSTMERVSKMDAPPEEQAPNVVDQKKGKKKKKEVPPELVKNGQRTTMVKHLRNPWVHGEFLMKDEKNNKYILRLEPVKKKRLQFWQEILLEMEHLFKGQKTIPTVRCLEHGEMKSHDCNYLLTSPYSLQIYEVLKVVGNFSEDCAFNVGLQCLDAIQYLHQAGYIHRNIKSSAFNIGYGNEETKVMLTDFRRPRSHFEPRTKPRKVRPARKQVDYGGSCRFASIAAMMDQDEGRKDDLESWIYLFYDLLDPVNGLSWRKMPRNTMMLKEKEKFREHSLPSTYKKIPTEFKKLIDMVHSLKYDSTPDYDALKEIVESVGKAKKLDLSKCDWVGKLTSEEIIQNAIDRSKLKSIGHKFSGDDDFENKGLALPMMNLGDVLKSETSTWTVVKRLGSGGFGAVYEVFEVKDSKKKYAMKTEATIGPIEHLRLKVEYQVMEAIADAKKNGNKKPVLGSRRTAFYNHFVDLVDRGQSIQLRCKFIVMSLVGPSLEDIRRKYSIKLHEGITPYQIAMQTLDAIEDLHSLGYIHRDMKPANFAVGFGPTEPTVFMLDFGIARSFLDPKTKKHKLPRTKVRFFGTTWYASRDGLKGKDQGRKDDIECWYYTLRHIFDPVDGIPWKEYRKKNDVIKMLAAKQKIFDAKNSTNEKFHFFEGFNLILVHIDEMYFSACPDYEHIRSVIRAVLERKGLRIEDLYKDGVWVGKLNANRLKAVSNNVENFSDLGSDEPDSAAVY
ncbi:hypothetical protein B9Z55_001530 [Caenorhabditis nigoni]|uniref:Protein kinase domain-containing protein n=1 Tax=Caenorhabditis nigoni TaxID=1611254 RepID=A0A2G5VG59_9PELO|nr:hypothetical protein B9Z55_001530 [Caenorhabditis nigoni]